MMLALLVALFLSSQAAAPNQTAALLQELIQAGELDRAERLLDGLEGDEATVATLRGWIALERSQPQAAVSHFRRALELAPERDRLWLYVGQAELMLGRYQQAQAALLRARSLQGAIITLRLRARAAWGTGDLNAAWELLGEAATASDAGPALERDIAWERGTLLVHMGAGQAFAVHLEGALASGGWSVEALRRWAEAAVAVQAPLSALERLRREAPEDLEIMAATARSYAHRGNHRAAGELYGRAALADPRYAHAAADQFTRAQLYPQALRYNARVSQPAQRLPQRAAIYVQAGEPERALALAEPLREAGLLRCHGDDCPGLSSRLQLAYASLASGDLRGAQGWLEPLPHNHEVQTLRQALTTSRR